MNVLTTFNSRDERLVLEVAASEQDREFYQNRKGKLGRAYAEFQVPYGFSRDDWHPDLEALVAVLVFGAFTRAVFTVSRGVSSQFAETVQTSLRRTMSPVDEGLPPRVPPPSGRDALAFSGGVDSVAALSLLPESSVPIFMHRVVPDGVKSRGLYRSDAALRSCADVKESGYDVQVVDTTMEYARDPVGFAMDWTNAAGAIVLADHLGLRSVSFGMIAESAFSVGHPRFSQLSERSIYSAWAPLFEAVGVPVSLPTSGLSEVMTSKIARAQAYRWSAQSCVRGAAHQPCMRCFKCFRKSILDARISDRAVNPSHFDIAYDSGEVRQRLLEQPIHHEDVLAFSVHGLRCSGHPVLAAIQKKTQAVFDYSDGVCFAESVYPGYLRYVPGFLAEQVRHELSSHAPMASEHQVDVFENWDTLPLSTNSSSREGQTQLEQLLGESV